MEYLLSKVEEYLLSKVESRVAGTRELSSDLDRLRRSLPRVNRLMDKAEWWRFKDPLIADGLERLREAAYDAEDVIAESDFYELQHKIEGQITSQFLSSLVSFVKVLVSNSTSKVKDAQTKLDSISAELESMISPLGSLDGSNPYGKAVQRETSSIVAETVLGREKEVEMVVKLMLQPSDGTIPSHEASSSSSQRAKRRKTSDFSVLPIVGMGGMGKTTLAQLIYNDERVKNHFHLKLWVCVSDYFDPKKITREIIESANQQLAAKEGLRNIEKQIGIGENFTNLDSMQQVLKGLVTSRRYLLVLDDVWNEKTNDWGNLFKPLRFGLEGSMILITTRIPKVALVTATLDPINIEGLPDHIYWELFKKCAFGSEDTTTYPELEVIGKRIAAKLKGSPLAAKTLGGILCCNRTAKQWRDIMDSELWQLKQDDGGISVALQLSYQYLPAYLKRCFLICSLFPKDFEFLRPYGDLLSPVWMADGIIPHENNIIFECNQGKEYMQELENRSFILRGQDMSSYVVHDLMHDLAKSISLNTCYCQEESNGSLQNHNSVRHLSVHTELIDLIDRKIGMCKKIRSLLFLRGFRFKYKLSPSTLASWFNQLPYLRLLDLQWCQIHQLPDNIGNLKLLVYLNLRYTNIKVLPESICRLYNLQVLKVDCCLLEHFPKMFHNLSNLRVITEWDEISSKIPGIGKLTSLERLPEFVVLKENGHNILELKNMTRLQGWMKISKLENVEGGRNAAQACLNNKEYLSGLTLRWSLGRNTSIVNGGITIDEDVIEALEPHPNLQELQVENYCGRTLASWFQKLPYLRDLSITGCSNLESLENWFVPDQLLSLRSLEINGCVNLVSLPLKQIGDSSITRLVIKDCPLLRCPSNLVLPSSLLVLKLDSCGELEKSLPNCLENVNSLKELGICNCQHVSSLPSHATNHLEELTLFNCTELQHLELSNPSILNHLHITKCPKLVQLDLSITENEAPMQQITKLDYLTIDNTSLLKLPFLRNPPRSLDRIIVWGSFEERMFTGDLQGWLNGPEHLRELEFFNCPNLESLPEGLHTVSTVKLAITNCPKIQSLPENGLPPSLRRLDFSGCHPALTEQLKQQHSNF